ncbi:MAG TPA: secretin N-terminal domain-containing protein [bacterium]|nr:secretin N-terminal domain-containing protein [bacterium]
MKKQVKIFVFIFFLPLILFANSEFTFHNAPLNLVLQALSKKTGIKLITNAELGEKPISVYLENVSGEQAIDSILKANGLYREKLPDTEIYVVKEFKETPLLDCETFFLQYAKAEELGKVLTSFIGPNGKISVDTRTNSLVIKDTSENLEELKKIIKSLDKVIPEISIEAVLVELTNEGLKDLGIKWNMEGSFVGGAKDVPYPWSKSITREIVNPRDVGGEGGTTGGTETTAGGQFILGTVSFQTLTASLRLLESQGEGNILANPRITTLNDSPATIKITRNMAVAERTVYNTETGAPSTKEPIYAEIGVMLIATPHINEEGFITLEVEPTVSSAEKSPFFADAVDTHNRTAKTTVMVKDGETIVIGGLLRTDTTKSNTKVPLLGDIFPFLFKNKADQTKKTDLVIFLTPRIITPSKASSIAEEEKNRIQGAMKDEK